LSARYEIRDYATLKRSRKKFHVWDYISGRDVFHTDKRERANEVIAQAGDGSVDQHLKDRGHRYVSTLGRCGQCGK